MIPVVYFYTALLSWRYRAVELCFAIPLALLRLLVNKN